MTASAFDPSAGRPAGPRSADAASSPPSPNTAERQLLESVLRETLALAADGESLASTDWDGVRGVVERHRGEPFSCSPVVSDLVGALLKERLNSWGVSAATLSSMSMRIAETLYDDTASRERLRVLWQRLCEAPLSEMPK